MSYSTELNKWLANPVVDSGTKTHLSTLDDAELEDRFYKHLDFGTGGLRAVMAAGGNRMNIYTIRHITQCTANELLACESQNLQRSAVVAFDTRLNSQSFARECAGVLSANGIKVYLFEYPCPTPELSFAVRYLKCDRGIMITASHNPMEYNGYKVYSEDGGQLSPENAKKIAKYMDEVDIFDDVLFPEFSNVEYIGENVENVYLECVKQQAMGVKIPDDLVVVYSSLHGAGQKCVETILKQIGVKNLYSVPEQAEPNGDFPTVPSPNPEDPRAFELALKYAKQYDADVVLLTDPDSDRIGVAAKNNNGEYELLNGNQSGALMFDYIARYLHNNGQIAEDSTVIKTIVTGDLVKGIAKKYGIRLIEVLTGFKFIGEQIKLMEDKGAEENFVFGLEESYGYLKGTYTRDKDAVVSAMIIAEIAALCKKQGITVIQKLCDLYSEYGFYAETLETKKLEGINGQRQISAIMHKFRTTQIDLPVTECKDYLNGIDGLPKSDVLKYCLKDNCWFAVRPSGTEPKIKFYFGVCGKSNEHAKTILEKLKSHVVSFALENVTD